MKSKLVIPADELQPFRIKEDRLTLKPERFAEGIATLQRITSMLLEHEDDIRTLAASRDDQIAAAIDQLKRTEPSREGAKVRREGDNKVERDGLSRST